MVAGNGFLMTNGNYRASRAQSRACKRLPRRDLTEDYTSHFSKVSVTPSAVTVSVAGQPSTRG